MSQFSNQLQASMEECDFTQTDIVEKIRISQGQMSRYVNGENRPEPGVVDELVGLFPEKQRTALLMAYLQDDVPARFRNLIIISPAASSARITEDSPVYRARMPKRLRTAYDFLGAAALEKPRVAQTLINTYELLKSGAA
jgi:hypothetical protein